jgi:hypothetical protein
VLGASVAVVIGGAGFGKSALAAESRDRLEVLAVRTVLESSGVAAALLPYRLRSAAARTGLSDLAAQMDKAAAAGPAGDETRRCHRDCPSRKQRRSGWRVPTRFGLGRAALSGTRLVLGVDSV